MHLYGNWLQMLADTGTKHTKSVFWPEQGTVIGADQKLTILIHELLFLIFQ